MANAVTKLGRRDTYPYYYQGKYTMHSLRAILANLGILFEFERGLDELDLPDKKIKDLQYQISRLVLDALVESGKTVVDDYEV